MIPFEDLYVKLVTKDGEKNIYKLAEQREKRTQDFSQAYCIK